MGDVRVSGPPGRVLRPESCTDRKCANRQRCVPLEWAPETSATQSHCVGAFAQGICTERRRGLCLQCRIPLWRVRLCRNSWVLNFSKGRFLKKGGVVAYKDRGVPAQLGNAELGWSQGGYSHRRGAGRRMPVTAREYGACGTG